MAKQPVQNTGGGKLRVFFAEFEGSDASIQESLRLIGLAATRTFTAPQAPRYLPAPKQEQVQDGTPGQSGQEMEQPPPADGLDGFNEPLQTTATPRSKPQKPRRAISLSIVGGLDLLPNGEQSFREFYAEKQPRTQPEQIAVAVYYLVKRLNLTGVTPNHIYTCFKDVNENLPPNTKLIRIPSDMDSSIRNCAVRHAWIDCSDTKNIKLTPRGEGAIECDLPRKSSGK